MPPLNNFKHEKFVQEIASGKTGNEAYVAAGFVSNRANAGKLRRSKHIETRLAELLCEREKIIADSAAVAIEAAGLTKEWVIRKLQENAERASTVEPVRDHEGNPTGEYTYQGSVVNRALELLGKELGMFIERKEVGKPGAFDKMTPEQKRERAVSLAKQLGIDRVGAKLRLDS